MDEATRDALDRNFRLASAEMFAASERGEALETVDVHCVGCGYPVADFNWAFLKLPGADPAHAIERAERHFGERRQPFRFVVRSDRTAGCEALLVERGHLRTPKTTPGMSILPLRAAPPPPDGLRIVRVASEPALVDFQRTAFSGFDLPIALAARFLTSRLLDSPETALFVGDVDDEPVATSMTIATGRVAGIYWVATLEAHRRKGHAEALTWAALEAGRALGCSIGSLQASELGRPVYARMGFAQTAEYVFFERPAEQTRTA